MSAASIHLPVLLDGTALPIRTATEPLEISHLRVALDDVRHRSPNRASQCLGLALRELPDAWQARHGFRPLLADSFHDPAIHQGTLYKATN